MSKLSNTVKKSLLGIFVLGMATTSLSACVRDSIGNTANIPVIRSLALMVVPNKDRIDVLDMQTNRVTQSLKTDQKPASIAASPDGRLILVSNSNSGTVSVFLRRDNESFEQLNSIGNGSRPAGIAFNPANNINEAYVAYEGDGKILVLDTSSKTAAPRITRVLNLQGAAPRKIAVSNDGNRIYVTDNAAARLIILTRTGSSFTRNEVALVQGIANTPGSTTNTNINLDGILIDQPELNPNIPQSPQASQGTGRVFVSNNSQDEIIVVRGNVVESKIGLKDNQITGSNQVGPRNMVIYRNPQSGVEKLYVAGYNASVISVIDVKSLRLIRNIPLSQNSAGRDSYNPVGVGVGTLASKEDVIYVTNASGMTISLVDPATDSLKRNLSTTISAASQDPLGEVVTVGPVR